MNPLDQARAAISPRMTPRPTPLHSTLIYVAVYGFWALLLLQAFTSHGIVAWSVGIVYVAYDTFLLAFVATKTLSLSLTRAPPAAIAEPARRLRLGVVLAAYNEAPVLGKTIDALLAQREPPDAIILADDGSSDESAAVLAALYGFLPPALGDITGPSHAVPALRWLRLPRGGKAVALNEALRFIDTDVVLTVDADTLLEPDAIVAMRRAFDTDPDLVVAGGILTPICDRSLSGRFFQWFQTYEYIRNFVSRYAWSRVDSLLLISGAFAAFRRDALLTVGGFDPVCWVEDYELIHRLHRYATDHGQTWKVRMLGTAKARTDAPARLVPFLRQRRRWFAGFLQTQYWNRDMTGTPRFKALGLAMMPVKAIDTFQPVYGLTAFLLLLDFIVTGRIGVVVPVFGIMTAKIVIDMSFDVWVITLYRRWTGDRASSSLLSAFLAALAEPFSFQLLRHSGAAWGWFAFLTGRQNWGAQARRGLLSDAADGKTERVAA